MVSSEWRNFADYSFDEDFPDIGGMPFSEVYQRRPKFVQFALIWRSSTGLFEKFQAYCKGRRNEQTNQQAA